MPWEEVVLSPSVPIVVVAAAAAAAAVVCRRRRKESCSVYDQGSRQPDALTDQNVSLISCVHRAVEVVRHWEVLRDDAADELDASVP